MTEKDLNTILKNSFKQGEGFCFKIPDAQFGNANSTVKNPFDSFAVTCRGVFYEESKLLKRFGAFPFDCIYPHQIENLLLVKKNLVTLGLDKMNVGFALIMLGVWIPRKLFRVFSFDIDFIVERMQLGFKSIPKVELEQFQRDNMFLDVHKDLVDFTFLREKIIYGSGHPTGYSNDGRRVQTIF